MNYKDIMAAFVIGCLVGSDEFLGGFCLYIIYNIFMRDKESD